MGVFPKIHKTAEKAKKLFTKTITSRENKKKDQVYKQLTLFR